MLATYQAGTDPALNAALNAVYTPASAPEIAAMIADLNTLKTALGGKSTMDQQLVEPTGGAHRRADGSAGAASRSRRSARTTAMRRRSASSSSCSAR